MDNAASLALKTEAAPKAATVPAPLSIAPDQLWYVKNNLNTLEHQFTPIPRYGNDGPWSTFLIGFGEPAQYIKSTISTSMTLPYMVLPDGCTPSDPSDCPNARGSIFYPNMSNTWQDLGLYSLSFEENLGIYENGQYAFDSFSLGVSGSNAPTLNHQVVAGIATKKFFLGT